MYVDIFAYIDPGTGSLFLQVILGGLLGIIVVFRNTFRSLTAKLGKLFSRKNASLEKDEDQ